MPLAAAEMGGMKEDITEETAEGDIGMKPIAADEDALGKGSTDPDIQLTYEVDGAPQLCGQRNILGGSSWFYPCIALCGTAPGKASTRTPRVHTRTSLPTYKTLSGNPGKGHSYSDTSWGHVAEHSRQDGQRGTLSSHENMHESKGGS